MCLDVEKTSENIEFMEHTSNYQENQEIMTEEANLSYSPTNLNIKSLCGGSLINHKPIFDPNGE